MIDKKEISKASAAHAKATWNHDEEQFACMDGFEAGAHWTQEEFKKSLWHDAGEEPTQEGSVIGYGYVDDELRSCSINWLKTRKDFFEIAKKNLTGKDAPTDEELEEVIHERWREFKDGGLQKWCYLSDIMPQEGGNL